MSIVNVLDGPGGGGYEELAAATLVPAAVEPVEELLDAVGGFSLLLSCLGRRVRGPVLKMHSRFDSKHLGVFEARSVWETNRPANADPKIRGNERRGREWARVWRRIYREPPSAA